MSALIIFLPFCSRNAKAPGWLIPGKKSKGCMTYFVAQLSLPQERLHSIRCPRSGSFYWLSCKVWMCACVRVCARVAHAHLSFSLSLLFLSVILSFLIQPHFTGGTYVGPRISLHEPYVNNFSVRPFWRVYGKGIIRKAFPFAFASIWLWLDTRLFFLFFFFNCYACWRGSWMTFYLF